MNDTSARIGGRMRAVVATAALLIAAAPLSAAQGSGRDGKVSPQVSREVKEKEQRKKSKKANLDVLVRFSRRPGDTERNLVRSLGGTEQ